MTEYGEVMGKGRSALDKTIPQLLVRASERLPAVVIDTLREQWSWVTKLDGQIASIARRMREWKKEVTPARAINEIPGLGLLTATAAVATMGDAKVFRSGREFVAWVGIVPTQTGPGGKINLHGGPKRGDTSLRTLLVHNPRSVLTHAKKPDPWIDQSKKRQPLILMSVALANKMAREIWPILSCCGGVPLK